MTYLKVKKWFAMALLAVVAFPCCMYAVTPGIKASIFGKMPDGRVVNIYTLTNQRNMKVKITTYGARIVSITVPSRSGKMADVVEGFDSLAGYLGNDPYFGATIGRFANRIAYGRFTLDGVKYQLPINDPPNSLHGGTKGFDKRVWKGREISQNPPSLSLTYISPNGQEGYPGTLHVKVVYTLTSHNGLRIQYTATTNKDTVINLTNHSYFNLAGQGSGSVLHQELMVNSDSYTPFNANRIPTGQVKSVVNTPFDFRKMTPIGARINEKNRQLKIFDGYSVNFILKRKHPGMILAAEALDPASGRELKVYTTQPALQFYSGNMLDGSIHGKGGKVYGFRSAFVLETQHYPDSPNHLNFPSTELKPGQTYHETTLFQFSTVH